MMVVNCAVITGLLTWRSSMHCTTLPDLSLYLYCANNLQTASTTFSFCLTTVTADWASFPKRIHRNKWSIFLQTVHFLSPTEQSQIQRRSPKAKNQNQQHQRTEGNKKALLLTSEHYPLDFRLFFIPREAKLRRFYLRHSYLHQKLFIFV